MKLRSIGIFIFMLVTYTLPTQQMDMMKQMGCQYSSAMLDYTYTEKV
jgi:hypothetical protein